MERATVMKAIEDAAFLMHFHPSVTEEMKISDICMDSLEYVQLLIGIETSLDTCAQIPDEARPSAEATIGALADWFQEVVNG